MLREFAFWISMTRSSLIRNGCSMGTVFTAARLACALMLIAAARSLASQEPPVIRVPVKLVIAPTLVFSSKGRLIQGLEARDFRLFDNNRPQRINLDALVEAPAVVVAVQTNQDLRDDLPFIARVGSVMDSLLLGENGKAAVLSYGDEVNIVAPFDTGDVQSSLRKLSISGEHAHMLDAGMLAIQMLKTQPAARARVLLFVGQSFDRGSTASLRNLRLQAQAAGVAIYSLTLPVVGKKFVSNTFNIPSMKGKRGGIEAGAELTSLIPALRHSGKARLGQDPFSQLTGAIGGTQIHFRKQAQLENGIIAIGDELRSTYLLTYAPDSAQPGYHSIRMEVDVPGARIYARPGYVRTSN